MMHLFFMGGQDILRVQWVNGIANMRHNANPSAPLSPCSIYRRQELGSPHIFLFVPKKGGPFKLQILNTLRQRGISRKNYSLMRLKLFSVNEKKKLLSHVPEIIFSESS